MFSIGIGELEELEPIKEEVECPKCGELHKVEYGDRIENGKKIPTKLLGFVSCGESSYLVSVENKKLNLN